MNQPIVCAVCLTADRPEMTRQAVECFRSQTYVHKRLLVLDSGITKIGFDLTDPMRGEWYLQCPESLGVRLTIGGLRNAANDVQVFGGKSDIICHFDSDDWSHPNRITEQVELLQSSGADCVGYNEMLFWREIPRSVMLRKGEAWLYRNNNQAWALGTSLMYWRKAWEKHPFPAISHGEDTEWLKGVKCLSVKSFLDDTSPRMVARIHSGNAGNNAYNRADMKEHSMRTLNQRTWERVPGWDPYCQSVFAK